MLNIKDILTSSYKIVVQFYIIVMFWPLNRKTWQTFIYNTVLSFGIICFYNQIIYLLIAREKHLMISLIQYFMYHIGFFKILSFQHSYKKWLKILSFIAKNEKFAKQEPKLQPILTSYRKYCKIIIITFWTMATVANLLTLVLKFWVLLLLNYLKMGHYEIGKQKAFFIWLPEDLITEGSVGEIVIQTVYGCLASISVMAWDGLVISTFILMACQFELIRSRFLHALDAKNEEDQRRNLIDCFKNYLCLMRACKLCNSLVSPVMFVYLLSTSVNLSTWIIQLTSFYTGQQSANEIRALLASAVVMMSGLLVQLLFFYWHANEITVQSLTVRNGLYESKWVDKSQKIRRLIAIMMMATSKRVVYQAGPLTEMSLATFTVILRTSYSFYTLMVNTK